MILNPNIKVYKHTQYVILYNTSTQISYKTGLTEYELLDSFLKNEDKETEYLLQNEKVAQLFENFKKLNVLVEECYSEKKKRRFIKAIYFTIDREHASKHSRIAESILYLCIPMMIFSGIIAFLNLETYKSQMAFLEYHPVFLLAVLIVTSFITTVIHESWHMFIAHNEGADVPQAGIKIFFVIYWAYVKIIGIKSLNKNGRIKIYIAGIAANVFWGGFFTVFALLLKFNSFISAAVFVLGLSNIIQALPNLLFILRLDGNFILGELFDAENINKDILSFIKTKNRKEYDIITRCAYMAFISAVIMTALSVIFIFVFSCFSRR